MEDLVLQMLQQQLSQINKTLILLRSLNCCQMKRLRAYVRHSEDQGTMANPDAGNSGAPAHILNPGNNVSLRAETNLKLAGYFLRHRTRISKSKTAALITLQRVRAQGI